MELDIEQQKLIKKLQTDPKLTSLFLEICDQQELKNILMEAASIVDDPRPLNSTISRYEILQRIDSFITSSKTPDRVDDQDEHGHTQVPSQYIPDLVPGQMIKIRFAGVGSEIDREHYAIVWDTKPRRDQVVVIPTTSLKETTREYKHNFSIGKVFPFSQETIVCVDQMTCISRKRIIQTSFGYKGATVSANLSIEQLKRVQDGFRVTWLNQKTLLQYLLENSTKFIPEFQDYQLQVNHLLRPFDSIRFDSSQKKTMYKLHNISHTFEISWYRSSISRSERNELVNLLAFAKGSLNSSGQLQKQRSIVRQDAYQSLLNAKII